MTTLNPGDIVQWIKPEDRAGVEILLQVEKVVEDTVYLDIVERSFADLSKRITTLKKTGKKQLHIDEAVKRKERHEKINTPREYTRRTQPNETFTFGVSTEKHAEQAAKHWSYVRAVRLKQLDIDLKTAKRSKSPTLIVNCLTEMQKYVRLSKPLKGLLARAMYEEDLQRAMAS